MTSVRASATLRAGDRRESRSLLLLSALLPFATGLSILGVALLLLLTPFWMHWALEASTSTAAAATPAHALAASDVTVRELLLGPGTFVVGGAPLYTPAEIAHLRDVRIVLWTFLALAGASAALLLVAIRRNGDKVWLWRSVARGGIGLAAALLVLGMVALAAFGLAFELFHRLLFPGGNFAFDPQTSNLVRLYPLRFWQLCAAAMGFLGMAGGLLTWRIGRRRAIAREAG